MASDSARSNNTKFYRFLIILYLLSAVILIYFAVDGLDFYLTSFAERPHHDLFKVLKPGGVRSHGFGVVGSCMMILMLLYSLRKRLRFLQNWGSLRHWLDIHIFFGIIGPLFIVLHSTLKLNGLVVISFWSMVAVALSGVLGRYLYLQIPHNIVGHELSLREAEEMNKQLAQQLVERFSLETAELQNIENLFIGEKIAGQNTAVLFLNMVTGDVLRIFRSQKIRKELRRVYQIPAGQIDDLFSLFKQKAQISRRITMWNRIHQLFHYWHVFHKPFALIMYIIMIIHVGISIWLGYTWVF